MEYVKIEKESGIYTLSVTLSEEKLHSPVFETNLRSVAEYFKAFIESNLEGYLKVEEKIGNMGSVILMGHLSSLLGYAFQILNYKKINGIYLKILANVIYADEDEISEKEKENDTLINTTFKGNHADKNYYLFLDMLILTTFASTIEFNDGDCELNDYYQLFLSDTITDYLNKYYNGNISLEEFTEFFQEDSKRMNDLMKKDKKLMS